MQMRMPLIPLITVDPYFTVWTENVTKKAPVHWTGANNTILGTVNVDGETYRFLGKGKEAEMDGIT